MINFDIMVYNSAILPQSYCGRWMCLKDLLCCFVTLTLNVFFVFLSVSHKSKKVATDLRSGLRSTHGRHRFLRLPSHGVRSLAGPTLPRMPMVLPMGAFGTLGGPGGSLPALPMVPAVAPAPPPPTMALPFPAPEAYGDDTMGPPYTVYNIPM